MSDPSSATEAEVPEPAGDHISARSVGVGVAWNSLAAVLPQLLTLVLSLVVARTLGPAEQGVQSFIIFVAVTAEIALALGLPLALQRTVSERLGRRNVSEAGYALRWGQAVSAVPAVVAAGITYLVGQLFYTDYATAWTLAAGYAFFGTLHSVSSQALLGLRQYRSASIIGLGLQFVSVPVIVVLLIFGHGVTSIVAVITVTSAFSAGLTTLLLRRTMSRQSLQGRLCRESRKETRKDILTYTMGGGLLVLLDTVVNQRSELAFLAAFYEHEPQQIAFFSVAFAATQTAYRVPAALIAVVLPTVTALLAAGQFNTVRRGYLQGQYLLLSVSALALGMLLGTGVPLITLLWGSNYAPAGHALLIMAVFPVLFGAMGAVAASTLLGAGKLRVLLLTYTCGAGATLVLDLLLIRPFGMFGAAAANGLGLLASTVFLTYTAKTTLQLVHPPLADIARHLALAAGIAAPGLSALLLIDTHPIWQLTIGVMGGGIVLLGLFPLLRPLAVTEPEQLERVLLRLPRTARGWVSRGLRMKRQDFSTTELATRGRHAKITRTEKR